MAAEFKVTTSKLDTSAGDLMDLNANYKSKWENIYIEVGELVGVSWEGETSEAFNERLEDYRNDFQEMYNVIEDYAGFLMTTAYKIRQAENTLASQASQLHIGV